MPATKGQLANAQPAWLGVGLCYQNELQRFVVEHTELIDYLEVVPDTAWTDHGQASTPRYVDDAVALRFFQEFRRTMPIVAHSIGLSIGSAHRFRSEHLNQIHRWETLLDFPWHSDHLAFNLVIDRFGEEYLLGVPFPVPLDSASLDLVVQRVREVAAVIGKPFLLENNVSYIEYGDGEFDEPTFLNELCMRTRCRLLLDVHNVYVNWRNGRGDMDQFFAALDLSRVVEIHLAGGLEYNGAYLDAHSGTVPVDLWPIAEDVVRACPNLAGLTFELLGSWFERMGAGLLAGTLARMRELATKGRSPGLAVTT